MLHTETKTDIYTRVTQQIIESLEKGVRPWVQPWNANHLADRIARPQRANGLPYTGINILLLWMSAIASEFTCNRWMTYKQAHELGAQVRKGEKGTGIVYADSFTKKQTTEDGEEIEQEIYFLKSYTVFNVEQITSLPEDYYNKPEPRPVTIERIEQAEKFFTAIPISVRHEGNEAYYTVSRDYIQLPPFETFKDAESYYAVRGHETIHSTRHPNRLNRNLGRKVWGDEGYAREELVAELGAAFLCADLGLTPETREDHAAYLQGWLKVLKKDKRAIFDAAAHAQRAVDYLNKLSNLTLQPSRLP
ncbi:DUF1738 domain-containing protein [Brasilonema sp. CT11]|nr:DUF1738 domain-containing protein [Brasilonema sp. CT11]